MMMRALLWKDARILADVFWAGLVLLCGSYFLALLLVSADQSSAFAWSNVIAGGASLTRFSSVLICALLGAYAFARESEDHSLVFLTSLPAGRDRILLSKVLVTTAYFVLLWFLSLTIMLIGMRAMGQSLRALVLVLFAMLGYIGSGVMAFGASWLASFFVKNAVGAAFAGLVSLAPIYTAQYAYNLHFNIENPAFFHPIFAGIMFVAGALGVGAGAVIYARFGCSQEGPRLISPFLRSATAMPSTASATWSPGRAKASKFKALMWKDYRLLKTSFLAGLGVLALPYAVAVIRSGGLGPVRTASTLGAAISVLVFAFWSGHIASAEKVSRTGDFLAYLPVPAWKAFSSRLGVVLAPAVILTALNVAVLVGSNNAMPGEVRFGGQLTWSAWNEAPHLIMGFALTNGAVVGFALAWFLSAYCQRPAVAIVAGVMAALVVLAFCAALSTLCAERPQGPAPFTFVILFGLAASALGAILLMAGFGIALRRQRAT